MSNHEFANVWDAIEDSPEAAENMKLRSVLMMALSNYVTRTAMSESQAADHFRVKQPRISELMNGKIHLFKFDELVAMLVAAGLRIEVRVLDATGSDLVLF